MSPAESPQSQPHLRIGEPSTLICGGSNTFWSGSNLGSEPGFGLRILRFLGSGVRLRVGKCIHAPQRP
ncbi:unnamed protein product [Linum trigynum]|uniref:Uncharacterized protein n=1 Tax=Linum trigynum TaxID=586398 RepID=A0AAV2CM86_9ROSI